MHQHTSANWTLTERILFRCSFVFVFLFVTSFSFPHYWLPDPGYYLAPFYEMLVSWVARTWYHSSTEGKVLRLLSDATGFYFHTFILLSCSIVSGLIWSWADRRRLSYDRLLDFFLVVVRYYLAIQLLMYGFNKVFKWQFYLPEPNTLFTTIGHSSKDLLYWSTMGISRPYTVFCGLMEVLAACGLLFRRTALPAAFLTLTILVQVAALNFSYDISVKLYTLFLVLLCLLIIIPFMPRVYAFLVLQRKTQLQSRESWWRNLISPRLYRVLKTGLLIWILADALMPYIQSENYNDDTALRPPLHGAYDVLRFVRNQDTLLPLLTDTVRWRRAFVHRKGYFIIQYMNDAMQDLRLEYQSGNRLSLQDYDADPEIWQYRQQGKDTLILWGQRDSDHLWLMLHKIDISALPVMQKGFHWTMDSGE